MKCSVSVFRRRRTPRPARPGADGSPDADALGRGLGAVGGSPLGDELVGATRN
ncbi:hypothetical protein [Streptomyces sp. KL116D]|uniref:hypothetical protein n=1 Tax=Streptomyces sp. KL116D TaxID=3045152 RepID=UPI0035563E33